MLVSFEWLQSLLQSKITPEAASRAFTARGLTVDSLELHGEGQAVFDIDIPANRPDCLGHLGLAREISAALGVPLASRPSQELSGDGATHINIDAPEHCSRYTARVVRGVKIGPSPNWVATRLEQCGLRSINNVVDASNLVLLETGNPIHFFDLAQVRDQSIRIALADEGLKFKTLDQQEHVLDAKTLMIHDGKGPVALAGIMGGAGSDIADSTTDVLIEAAHFSPQSIRRSARRVGLHTDASHRFERGVDPLALDSVQALAVKLLTELAGGQAELGWTDVHPTPAPAATLQLRSSELMRLLGYQPSDEQTLNALTALGLQPKTIDSNTVEISVPSWRVDLEFEADLVEEVARHLGYDQIPDQAHGVQEIPPQSGLVTPLKERQRILENRSRVLLADLGFHEAYGYAMIGPGEDEGFADPSLGAPLPLLHPLAETMGWLRRSIVPGLVAALNRNRRRGVQDIRLFEVGRVFHPQEDSESLPQEPLHLGIAWAGSDAPRHWSGPSRDVDWDSISGLVEAVLRALDPSLELTRSSGAWPAFHPGRSLHWVDGHGRRIAWAGCLHPSKAEGRGSLPVLAEIHLGVLAEQPFKTAQYQPLSKLGHVQRDLAVVFPKGRSLQAVLERMKAVPSPVPSRFQVVDRYEGKPLPEGSASLTIRVELQPHDKSLTDDQIESYRASLVELVENELQLEIRG